MLCRHLAAFGFLHGFDWLVWVVVALQVRKPTQT